MGADTPAADTPAADTPDLAPILAGAVGARWTPDESGHHANTLTSATSRAGGRGRRATSDERQVIHGNLNVVLVEPEIAANVGAIGRTCVAAGARLWLVRPLGFRLDDRHLRRAGLDYWPHLDLKVVDRLDEAAEAIGADRLWLFSSEASRPYTDVTYRPGDALVFGRESRGLPDRLLAEWPDHTLRIPIRPEARSLNLANATAIALFEAVRQLSAGTRQMADRR
jgi:tRNA (cytidine/uridine-2'-O-)-methyltransferase